ncbi:MAG: LysM peptidoglycan-binding domain-containing protein [Burkholderiaceae bacterium]
MVRGDTLSGIASKYGVTMAQLRQWNRLRGSTVRLGQRLMVGEGRTIVQVASKSSTAGGTIKVRSGDTLIGLARRHGVSLSELRRWNGLRRDRLLIGQTLRVSEPAQAKTAAVSPQRHRVRRGDTLSEIAERYGVSIPALRQLNGLTDHRIRLGQTLRISRNDAVLVVAPDAVRGS